MSIIWTAAIVEGVELGTISEGISRGNDKDDVVTEGKALGLLI